MSQCDHKHFLMLRLSFFGNLYLYIYFSIIDGVSMVNSVGTNELKDFGSNLALIAVVVFGFISLFGDVVYEGARGIVPSYLELLLAPAFIVGFAVGLGEFLGYALRLVFGVVADVKKAYWPLTILGYMLIGAIPLLALAGRWDIAVVLVVVERLGKAVRSPARDTILSVTTSAWGRGKAFGFHELMDQVGATLGPLIVALSIYYQQSLGVSQLEQIRFAFRVLAIPYLVLLVVLFFGYLKLRGPTNEILERFTREGVEEALGGRFYSYSLSVLLNTAGLFPFALILYLATVYVGGDPKTALWFIPLVYLLMQLVDAVIAPIAGALYDRIGRKVLFVPYVFSLFPTVLVYVSLAQYYGDMNVIYVIAVVFGVVLGMQESVYRAAVADLTGVRKRGTGYGIFNALYGLGFWVGGSVLGYILDLALKDAVFMFWGVVYTIVLQVSALFLLAVSLRG